MRRPIIVANWKMYTRAADAQVLATLVRNGIAHVDLVEVVLCPPAVWLSEISSIVGNGPKISLGIQNIFYESEGAYTGEISPFMARDLARYVIIGHSERREHFGETDFDVNEKVIAALKAGLSPIVCVGEKKKSTTNPTEVLHQLKEALMHVPKENYKDIIVAYEPVWAIGTGNTASADYAAKVISQLREIVLRDSPILYGGSVNSQNAIEFGSRPEIDGLLVGGASLRAAEFINICKVWADNKNFKNDVMIKAEEEK